ncbi:MAG: PAS domain-containing protein [Desulfobacteraceae bacterium]|nr:PAS domain-containing protein [Desulfobacteraceae bacterium]MBC2755437.1 PAS domain-containing protein [Desulfobacteraceae bacterium]
MSILSFFDFISFLIYAGLGIYILVKNPDAALNRFFFGITCCFAVWTFALVFYDDPRASEETARLSIKIGSLGWICFGSFVFPFFVFFTEKNSVIPLKKLSVILIAVPALLLYQQWQHESLISDLIQQSYGWAGVWQQSVWTYLYFAYYTLTTGIGLLLVFDYWRKTDNPDIKHQSLIIFVTGMFALTIGSLINVMLPVFNIYNIPAVGHFAFLFWVCGIAYAIIRYRFLTITPVTAAENILSTMTEALILLDPMGRIITVNKATVDMLDYKKVALEGRMFEEVFVSKNDATLLSQDLIAKKSVKNEEFRFITKEKKSIPVILSATLLKDEWGNIAGIICVARDISDRIKMQKRLFAVHKLESIRSLAGGIAHEYNNKLSVLSCNADLLQLKLSGNQAVEKNLEPMKTAISQISDLTTQLVAYARGGKYQPVEMDINHLVTASLGAIPHAGSDDIHIEKTLGSNLPKVIADYDQMQMVLHIILSNALEAMQGKGRIQISVSNVEISGDYAQSHAGARPGHYVSLIVTDDGKGMDEQTLKQIFDPFFSTKVQGRGLGMAAVYGIIKNHDGFIDVSSQIGKGTSVCIYLPAVEAKDKH